MVHQKTLLYPCQRLSLASQFSEDDSHECSCLMIASIENQTTVQLIQCIIIAALRHTDSCRLEIAGIGPCLVPGRFPEKVIGLVPTALILQGKGKVKDGLTIIRIRIAFLPYLHSLTEIALCLVKASTAQVP